MPVRVKPAAAAAAAQNAAAPLYTEHPTVLPGKNKQL
jgi:hypothetical protein